MKLVRNNELFRSACFFAGLMCLLSLLPLPMLSFVTVVRYVAVIAAVWGLAIAWFQKAAMSALKLLIAAVVMNPFAPLLMDPSLIRLLTVVSAVIFFAAGVRLRAENIPASFTPAHEETE